MPFPPPAITWLRAGSVSGDPSLAQAIEIPKFYGDRAGTRPLLTLLFSLTFILQTMGSHWKVWSGREILPSSLYFKNVTAGLPWWLSDKESTCQCRRHGFDPWVVNIPWWRKWQHTPVFLPRKSHGQRSLGGHSSWDHKDLDMTW